MAQASMICIACVMYFRRLLNREARNAVTAISPLRRTFCLVVLFDLILTVILWIFYTEVRKKIKI